VTAGETGKDKSSWTVDTLAVFMQRQIDDMWRALDERSTQQGTAVRDALQAAEKAVTKAEVAAERRFEAVNEFRGQLSDQAGTFMPRSEADVRFGALAKDIGEIKKNQSEAHGRGAGVDRVWAFLVAAVLAAGGVVSIIVAVSR